MSRGGGEFDRPPYQLTQTVVHASFICGINGQFGVSAISIDTPIPINDGHHRCDAIKTTNKQGSELGGKRISVVMPEDRDHKRSKQMPANLDRRPRHMPCAHTPGAHIPCSRMPGAHVPGAHIPCTHTPGAHMPCTHTPGAHIPGAHVLGAHTPCTHMPGAHIPCTHMPCTHMSGAHMPYVAQPPSFVDHRLSSRGCLR